MVCEQTVIKKPRISKMCGKTLRGRQHALNSELEFEVDSKIIRFTENGFHLQRKLFEDLSIKKWKGGVQDLS